ncbi:Sulfotransferase 1C1, partial [Ophiophagus hannah]
MSATPSISWLDCRIMKYREEKKVICGSWFDHVCGWWEAKKRHPILYLFYEDMKEDPIREMRKIAQFLGLEVQEPVLNQILEHTQFETMKGNKMANYSNVSPCLMDHTVSPFLRKGIVGDWKEHFTVSQSEHLDGICSQLLEGSVLFALETMELPSSLEDLDPKFVTRCSLIEIEGVSLPTTTAKHWDQIKSFQARPDDLLICSYPKAGNRQGDK